MPSKEHTDIVTAKDRKLYYDEYSKTFYFETKLDSVERNSLRKVKEVQTKNRGEIVELNNTKKQLIYEKHIQDMKKSREMEEMRDSLREHVAHQAALRELVDNRSSELSDLDDNKLFGKYGLNTSRQDLTSIIAEEIKNMSGEERRKREARRLREKRKDMALIDRNISTEEIFAKRKSQSFTCLPDIKDNYVGVPINMSMKESIRENTLPKTHEPVELKLPAIVAKKSNKKQRLVLQNRVSRSADNLQIPVDKTSLSKSTPDECQNGQVSAARDDPHRDVITFLPSIFVTDNPTVSRKT